MPVGGVKEVELIVLGTLVKDLLAIDHDPKRSLPCRQLHLCFEGLEPRPDVTPSFPFLDEILQSDPSIEGHLDGVFGMAFQVGDDFLAEIGPVEPKFEDLGPEGFSSLGDEITKEGHGRFSVMDVSTSIAHPQHVTGLRKVCGDRIVAWDFSPMRVVASECSFDLESGGAHGAIDVDGDSAKLQGTYAVCNEFSHVVQQCIADGTGASAQPTCQSALAREDRESGKAKDDRIADQVLHVSHAAGTDDEHGDDQPDETGRGEICGGIMGTQSISEPSSEADLMQETPEELKAAERCESLGREAQGKIPIDPSVKRGFS